MLPSIYQHSSLAKKLAIQKQRYPERKPYCLFSDLDDTYIMKYWPSEEILKNNPQKETDILLSPDPQIYKPSLELKQYLDSVSIPLFIVTGRDIYQMKDLICAFKTKLPEYSTLMDFDGIIGGVGTEIFIRTDQDYEVDQPYQKKLIQTKFNRNTLLSILRSKIPHINNQFHPIAFDFSKRDQEHALHEHPKQSFKLSIEFQSNKATAQRIYSYICTILKANNLASIHVLMSNPYMIDEDIGKFNLDVVPFSKDQPILYLKKLLEVQAIVTGDSGNDFDMLTQAADIGIIVGNAKEELLHLIHMKKQFFKHLVFASKKTQGPISTFEIIKKIENIE